MKRTSNGGWVPLLKSYTQSKKVNSISFAAETLFTRLLTQCDDNGNYDGRPAVIMCHLYSERFAAGKITVDNVDEMLEELIENDLVVTYEVEEQQFLHIVGHYANSRVDVKPDIRFPEFTEVVESQELTECVTDAERTRNECVTDTERIRDEPVTKTARYNYNYNKNINNNNNSARENEKKPLEKREPAIPEGDVQKLIRRDQQWTNKLITAWNNLCDEGLLDRKKHYCYHEPAALMNIDRLWRDTTIEQLLAAVENYRQALQLGKDGQAFRSNLSWFVTSVKGYGKFLPGVFDLAHYDKREYERPRETTNKIDTTKLLEI